MPTFSHPVLLLPAAVLVVLGLGATILAQTRPGLGVRVVGQRPWVLGLGLVLVMAGAGLGLAEPRWGLVEHPRLTVHVVLDASRSMLAEHRDGRSRWEASLRVLDRLWAESRPGLRFSLDLLTGDSIPLIPPGEDRGLLRDALRAVRPGEVGSPGTSLGRGLEQVAAQAPAGEPAVILLLTDGEETWEPEAAAEARALEVLRRAHLPLLALGLGGPDPAEVPGGGQGAEPTKSRANPDLLRRLAEGSGGRLLAPSQDPAPILLGLAEGRLPLPTARSKQPAHPEWGAWLALGGLACWMLGAGRPLSAWRVRL